MTIPALVFCLGGEGWSSSVGGRWCLRVGLVDVIFEGSFLKPTGGRLFLVKHENAATASMNEDAECEMTV